MVNIDLEDGTLFGNEAADDEEESVLMSYFVDQPAFKKFLDPGRRLWVANGRKGVGKSALLARFAHDMRHGTSGPAPLVIHTVPSRLVTLREPPQTENHALLENYWKQVVCAAINMDLANEVGFAWTDNQMALVDSAEISGFKGRNLVSALVSRLVSKVSVSGVEMALMPKATANHEQLLGRLSREDSLKRPVWFLLDDLDARFRNTPEQQALIASFFSASRKLVKDISGVGIRATVRSDVWTSLTHAEDMDKVEQYRTEIKWSATQQKALLATRILAYVRRNYPESDIARTWTVESHDDQLIQLAFVPKMRWSGKLVPPEHPLRLLGGGRPRWSVQLCSLAADRAVVDKRPRIAVQDLNHSMGEYGRRRLSDLYKEHRHQFEDLQRLIESFSLGPRRYTTAELLERIRRSYEGRTAIEGIPEVDGAPYKDSLQLAHFLFKCGFVSGNNSTGASLEMPEFVSYDTRPDLLSVDTNLDSGMSWDVHPAYRNILQINS